MNLISFSSSPFISASFLAILYGLQRFRWLVNLAELSKLLLQKSQVCLIFFCLFVLTDSTSFEDLVCTESYMAMVSEEDGMT